MFLEAISPVDGRYGNKTQKLQKYFSETALISARIEVELRWLIHLAESRLNDDLTIHWLPTGQDIKTLNLALQNCHQQTYLTKVKQAAKVKQIEKTTNHDVKAVEYYLKDQLQTQGVSHSTLAMIHFGCTSEDINNLAYGVLQSRYHTKVLIPTWGNLYSQLKKMATECANLPILSLTHGQPATPTTMGKELAVFATRLHRLINDMKKFEFLGKMNGAVGNFNAHVIACSSADWEGISSRFIEEKLCLKSNKITTQIESHDCIARWCHLHVEAANIQIDLSRDIWHYISRKLFKQKVTPTEVGSSTMPHKINPIDFENAEGNFGLCVALGNHFANKLPISRMQRDLSDSTVQRSIGVMATYMDMGCNALLRGLQKIHPDPKSMSAELKNEFSLLTEAAQTVMRTNGVTDAYERLKEASRGKVFDQETYLAFIQQEESFSKSDRERLVQLSPLNYTGYAKKFANDLTELSNDSDLAYKGQLSQDLNTPLGQS